MYLIFKFNWASLILFGNLAIDKYKEERKLYSLRRILKEHCELFLEKKIYIWKNFAYNEILYKSKLIN